ncbi:MAG: HAMP domain-containing protein, partial [Planctomycetota bacterium]
MESGKARKKPGKAPAGDAPVVEPTVAVSKDAVAKAAAAQKGGKKKKGGPKKRPSASKVDAGPPPEDDLRASGSRRRRGGDDGGGGRRGGRDMFRAEGATLAKKFAVAVAITIFGLMAIFSVIIFNIAKGAIEEQIEEDGVIAVSLAAKLAEEYHVVRRIYWFRYKAKWEEMSTEEKDELDEDQQREMREDSKKYAQEMKRLKDRYTRHVKEMKNFPTAGGGEISFERVLLVAILGQKPGGGTTAILRSNDFESFEPAARVWRLGGNKTEIRIGRGNLKGRPYWLFTRPCYDLFQGGVKHPDKWTANVFLNASSIEAAQGRLMMQIFLWLLLVVAGGAGVTLFVARKVTEPVKILIDDIDAVASGDLEHRTIPHSKDEIGVIARAFNAMTE